MSLIEIRAVVTASYPCYSGKFILLTIISLICECITEMELPGTVDSCLFHRVCLIFCFMYHNVVFLFLSTTLLPSRL